MRKCDSDISQGDSAARSLRRGGVAYKNEIEMLFGVDRNDSADDVISNEEGDSLQPSDTNSLPPIHSIHIGKMSRVSALSDFDIGTVNNYTSKPDPPEQRKLYKQSSTLTSVDENDTERDTLSSGEHKVADEQYESRIKEKLISDKRSEMKRSINSSTSTYSSASTSNDKFEDRLRQKMEQGKPSSMYTSRLKNSINSSSTTATPNDTFEDRLRAKMKGDSKSFTASSFLSNDKFDDKVNAKMSKQNDSSGGISTSQNGSDGFESRLRAKLKDGNRISGGASTTSSNPSDRFEGRLREKMRMSDDNSDSITLQSKNSRVSHESDKASGEFENRLRAKMQNGNKKQTSLPAERSTPSPRTVKQLEEKAIVSYTYISECSEEGRFNDILKCTENNPRLSASVVSQVIEKLNDSLALAHDVNKSINDDKDGDIARLNKHWVKVLASNMSNHNTNETVQLSALRTIWLIVSLDLRYSLEFVSNNDGLNALVIAMKNHQQSKPIQIMRCGHYCSPLIQ